MSELELKNIVGFKAVDAEGNEQQVTVDEMAELVSARIVSAASEISTFAATAAAGTDEFEDQLPVSDTFSWLRTMDGSNNPTLTSSTAAAKVLGELIGTATKEKKGLVAPDMFSFTRSATDANGCSVFGSYRLSPSTLNVPDGIKYGDVLFVVQWDTNTMHQFIYTISGGTYRRVGGKENWSGWVKD